MTKIFSIFLAALLLSLFGCAQSVSIDPVQEVEPVATELSGLYGLKIVTEYDSEVSGLERTTLLTYPDHIDVGMFNDHCRLLLPGTTIGWQNVETECTVPETGALFRSTRASIQLGDRGYILVVEGVLRGQIAQYSSIVGKAEH